MQVKKQKYSINLCYVCTYNETLDAISLNIVTGSELKGLPKSVLKKKNNK